MRENPIRRLLRFVGYSCELPRVSRRHELACYEYREFFTSKGVTDYRIVESLGATEGTPASGTADIVVDITTTGATLKANGLRILDDPKPSAVFGAKPASTSSNR